jgi:hypothetical protein
MLSFDMFTKPFSKMGFHLTSSHRSNMSKIGRLRPRLSTRRVNWLLDRSPLLPRLRHGDPVRKHLLLSGKGKSSAHPHPDGTGPLRRSAPPGAGPSYE